MRPYESDSSLSDVLPWRVMIIFYILIMAGCVVKPFCEKDVLR